MITGIIKVSKTVCESRMKRKLPLLHRVLLKCLSSTCRFWPDKAFLSVKYRLLLGYWLDFVAPKTFNEKLQWLKLYNRAPEHTQMVDKITAKQWVTNLLKSDDMIVPTYGVWDRFDDIDFDALPEKFVLKANHDSGCVYICRDKSKIDKDGLKRVFDKSLANNFYYSTREWPYKDVKPRILAEELLELGDGDICDYKFFCFNGRVEFMKIDFDRHTCHGANYYDREFNLLELEEVVDCPRNPDKQLTKPQNFEGMIELAEKISKNFKFLRVDFYEVGDKIYFGEMTFFPASGMGLLGPDGADLEIGKLLDLGI